MSDVRNDERLFRWGDLFPRRRNDPALPPGQRALATFPRFGRPQADPPIPERVAVTVTGVGLAAIELDPAALRAMPRVDLIADFHCVAGWTARDVHWEGVRFRDLYETVAPPEPVTHIRVVGRDGWHATLLIEDALAGDVVIADRLNGQEVPLVHGGPLRFVSASQYGYKSVKHLRRIELHDREPAERFVDRFALNPFAMHPRARVALEERHRVMPGRAVREVFTRLHAPFYAMGYLGSRRRRR